MAIFSSGYFKRYNKINKQLYLPVVLILIYDSFGQNDIAAFYAEKVKHVKVGQDS